MTQKDKKCTYILKIILNEHFSEKKSDEKSHFYVIVEKILLYIFTNF